MRTGLAVTDAEFAGCRTRVFELAGSGPRHVLLHGFGEAGQLRPGPVLSQLDAFIDDLLASQGNSGTVVVGNSLGACLALRAAARQMLYADPRAADAAVLHRFAEFFWRQGGHGWLARNARVLGREVAGGCHDFAKVTCPVLVVHGARDRIIPVAAARVLHQELPGSHLVIRPNWGHCPQLDDPGGLARLVAAFVGDHVG